CLPPLKRLIVSRGNRSGSVPVSPAKYFHSGIRERFADALANAIDTAKIAFAPSRDLSRVPSSSIKARSTSACSESSRPANARWIFPSTSATACRHPSPRYRRGSPSRSSCASASPVDAPEGTDAETGSPFSNRQVAKTVGRPRLSRISRAASLLTTGMRSAPQTPPQGPEFAPVDSPSAQPLHFADSLVPLHRDIQAETGPLPARDSTPDYGERLVPP